MSFYRGTKGVLLKDAWMSSYKDFILKYESGKTLVEIVAEWVQEHYGFHVTNLNIAQVKQKHGIIERENYNKPKSENSRQP